MPSEVESMNPQELTEAVNQLLKQDEARAKQRRQRHRQQLRKDRKQMESTIERMTQSIEVIKWCIVSITTVMAISLIIMIMVVMEVEREAERIKVEVQGIQREAEMIRDKIKHPLESLGGTLGRRLENSIFSGGDNEE